MNSVSIIIPNLNGQPMLEGCIGSIKSLEHEFNDLEIILVDNGSVDGSCYWLSQNHPEVKVISLGENTGFSRAVNIGAQHAQGELLFFLNNDARVDPDCLTLLSEPILDEAAVCSSAQIINQSRDTVHFDGGGMNFHGIAFQYREGEPFHVSSRAIEEALFPCGAAMMIRKEVFLEVGGFDERFFAYFEDVDLGWRLRLLGYKIVYVPNAIATHNQSRTSRFVNIDKLRVLHIRNPLIMVYKNYSDECLSCIWPVAWMLTVRRTRYLSHLDQSKFRIDHESHLADPHSDSPATRSSMIEMPSLAVSDAIAMNDFLDWFPSISQSRNQIQAKRKVADETLFSLFKDPFRYCEADPQYQDLQDSLCTAFGVDRLFNGLVT